MSRKKKAKTTRKRGFQQSKPEFKVLIYESEYRQIQAWTAKFPNLETGGDLFGLWLDDHTAVVQLVLGPGKALRRTGTSFYQDVNYLERVGNHLTTKEGLCHIGEWHSHHRLGLTTPSGGDKNTVWTNMRRYGIYRFCLFIATIVDSRWSSKGVILNEVNVNGYLFEIDRRKGCELPLLPSKFEYIQEYSPFRQSNEKVISKGAESLNNIEDLEKENYCRETEANKNSKSDNSFIDSQPKGKKGEEAEELVNLVANDEDKTSETTTESWFGWFSKNVHDCLCIFCYYYKRY